MKLPYREGTVFAVPLRVGGYAIGVVARASQRGRVIFGYFFGPARENIPSIIEVGHLRCHDAVKFCLFGDLSLINGEWVTIFDIKEWDRRSWPMQSFVRDEEFTGRRWMVTHSDDDPVSIVSEIPISKNSVSLERDSIWGAGAVEIELTKLLAGDAAKSGTGSG